MIYEAIQILSEQLDNYLSAAGLSNLVTLENIAMIETSAENADKLNNKVVLTLLMLDEESILKNQPNYKVINKSSVEYKNPPVNLNIFLLVSANCNTYVNSLRSISKTIEFFQGKSTFTSENTTFTVKEDFDLPGAFKFIVNLFTPTFEQLNHIWGTMGGRQLPSVIYEIQLIEIDQNLTTSGNIILEVQDELELVDDPKTALENKTLPDFP